MKSKKAYWILGIAFALLISLLVNQIIYVYNAATQQEADFNNKAKVALDSIVDEISSDYKVCNTLRTCIDTEDAKSCDTKNGFQYISDFRSKEEWHSVDSIIKSELEIANLDLKYNFDFCMTKPVTQSEKGLFAKELGGNAIKSGVVMHLEFPSKSNFVFKQMGSTFLSSILIILLISIVFMILFEQYKREKRNAEKTHDFLNNMTHEFKTPLANISFANNFLRRKSENITPDHLKKYTDIIESENNKILNSSHDILELAKQEYDFSKVALETIQTHDVIQNLQRIFTEINRDKNVLISLNLDAQDDRVLGKQSFLQNALSNLIDNAIVYCESSPEIEISTRNEKESLLITIKDNGIGITKTEVPYIFDKFYRVTTGNLHNVKGFGLGLAYVKRVIEQMKGSIAVTSEIGIGSTFTIKLPKVHG